MFNQHFRGNEVANSRLIMGNTLETAILLALETKDIRFDKLAKEFIETGYFGNSPDDYVSQLIRMYKTIQKQIAEENK